MKRATMLRAPFSIMERRRELVGRLVARRLSHREIVEALDKQGERNPLTQQPWSRHAILDDIHALERLWREQYSASIAEHKAKQLSDLEAVIRQAWMDKDMGIVLAAMAQKARLLGLDAPTRIDIEARIREMATENGYDPDEAVKEAQRVINAGRSRT